MATDLGELTFRLDRPPLRIPPPPQLAPGANRAERRAHARRMRAWQAKGLELVRQVRDRTRIRGPLSGEQIEQARRLGRQLATFRFTLGASGPAKAPGRPVEASAESDVA